MLTEEQAKEIADHTIARARSGMRVVIGDSTTKQYDRADLMAGYIHRAVIHALRQTGHLPKEKPNE